MARYKKEMTNNEYIEYLRFLANNYCKGLLTYEKFNKILDSIKILNFDLTKYNFDKKYIYIINKYFTENYTTNGKEIFKGFIDHEKAYKIAKMLDCKSLAGHYYSEAYCNDKEMFFFSVCEGDIYFKAFNDLEAYESEKESIIQFYKNN